MSTFERMLSVLDATASTATERLSFGSGAASRKGRGTAGAVTASVSGRKRGRRRAGGNDGLSSESLEQRQMLAVSTFATTDNGGIVTIVAEGGDNVYIQQVATAPQSLYVADNSSFQRRTVVGGPQFIGATPGATSTQYLTGLDFTTISSILIRSGTERVETVPQSVQGYPMTGPGTTVFTLPKSTDVAFDDDISGTISLVQSDGTKSYWSFTNNGGGQPDFTNVSVRLGDVYPTAIVVNATGTFFLSDGVETAKSTVTVTWSVSALASEPTLETVSWQERDGNFASGTQSAANLLPSAPSTAFISLPNAAGPGLNPIIATTFLGNLVVDGVALSVTSDSTGTLYFGGLKTKVVEQVISGGALRYQSTISGRLITGSELDPVTNEYRRGLSLDISGEFPVSLQSARYALASGGDPNTATVFAGHDITAGLDFNLTSPGSSIAIDSPVSLSTSNKNIILRASTVDINAPTDATAAGRMSIGHPVVDAQTGFETAGAVAEIRNGKVTKLTIPSGRGGAGYDAASPPKVTFSLPESLKARLSLTGLTGGSIPPGGIKFTDFGVGYTAAPRVIISVPPRGGTTATATAVFAPGLAGAGGTLTGINVDSGGSGYTQRPTVTIEGQSARKATATATIVGSIGFGNVGIVNPGFGYTANSRLTLQFTGSGTGAAGYAQVNAAGSVETIVITAGGSGYGLDTLVEAIGEPTSVGTAATAEAIIDPATTRIVDFKITDPGSGYGRIPLVSIAPPLPKSPAGRPVAALNAGGGVASIDFASGRGLAVTVQKVNTAGSVLAGYIAANAGGSGYAVGDLVNIDSSKAGRSAQFKVLQVDPDGAVQRVAVAGGGTGYIAGESLSHDGVASRGRGYNRLSPPQVFVARPDDPVGRQATAKVELDQFGSITRFIVTDPGSGYATTPSVEVAGLSPLGLAETVRFNADVRAGVYDIEIADDPGTPVDRSLLLVRENRALAGGKDKNKQDLAADSVTVEVHQGDIRVAGTINAKNHSYLMQSNPRDASLAPFLFTTESTDSGVQTGTIQGDTVAVTLANDLPTPFQSAVAFNLVSLTTAVDSIRLRAAHTDGQFYTGPFPYKGDIYERDDINIDAVAASSYPIFITAGGDIFFRAALTTAGGLRIAAPKGTLTMAAPVSTQIDQIVLSAGSLQINSSLQVTDMPVDEVRPDIVLEATAGEITLQGGVVKAPGRIVVKQKTGKVPKTNTYSGLGGTAIVAGKTVSVPLSVADDFAFDQLALTLSLAVTNPSMALSSLSATLVSPNGSSFPLFGRFTVSGKSMTDTVFTPESTTRLFSSKEPYTGTFQPDSADGLVQLYNRVSAKGRWRLDVTSSPWSPGGDIGSISKVSLSLRNPVGGTAGDVYGTSLIAANSLLIDAEGSVGNPALQPAQAGFYLRTDVDTVIGTAGGSFSLADVGDVNVASLRADGIVSLRADGVDRADGRAALTASLSDIPAIDVSALAGSIDVQVTTATVLELGNRNLLSLAAPFRTGVSAMKAAGNVLIRTVGGSQGGDIVVLDAPAAGSNSRQVRGVATSALANATYSPGVPGIFPGRIDATVNGSLNTNFSGITSSLIVGHRILVAGGVAGAGDIANGIYEVRRVGSANTKWQLVRTSDADTLGELPARTFVTPVDGPLRGQVYQVTHQVATANEFGKTPIDVRAVALTTNIGSDDAGDTVSFVVSTTDGTNSSPGSLGKLIGLRQQNDTSRSFENPDQQADFLFSGSIAAPIQLSQELPVIAKAFAIDGKQRYPSSSSSQPIAIDGSRIVTSRTNAMVGLTTTVDGFVFGPAAGGAAASLKNVVVGGFARGAAIKVDGVPNVVIDKVSVGVDALGGRLSNLKSVVVTATSPAGTAGVTISDSVIAGGAVAGISLEGAASGVKIYGTKIGLPAASNTVGILASSTGANAVGDPAFGRNVISYNGTGTRLTAGSITLLNTDVTGNAGNGIDISGGSHLIGRLPRDAFANAILGNGGFGVAMTAAAASRQLVRGNLIGVGNANKLGNVGVDGKPAAAPLGYTSDPKTGVDKFQNQHLVATMVAPGKPTPTPGKPTATPVAKPIRPLFSWRPRRR